MARRRSEGVVLRRPPDELFNEVVALKIISFFYSTLKMTNFFFNVIKQLTFNSGQFSFNYKGKKLKTKLESAILKDSKLFIKEQASHLLSSRNTQPIFFGLTRTFVD